MKKLFYIFILIAFVNQLLYSQIKFVENRGQMPNKVEFKVDFNFAQIYFEKDRFTYNLINKDDLPMSEAHHGHHRKSEIINCHAYQMKFVNANSQVNLNKSGKSSYYENYFQGKKENWASRVYSYQEIKYNNIYDNINIIVKPNNAGIKYDYEVLPHGNPQNITIEYDGVNDINIENGKLILKTSLFDIIELKPYSYQIINGAKVEIKSKYVLKNGVVSFKLGNYNKNEILIIDPALIFSTYSGSTTDNWGFTATYDSKGNVYSGGIVKLDGYPASIGAYQITNGGNWDIAIIKYNDIGSSRLWATYLGGIYGEMPHSLVVNANDELIVYGTTGSSDFPVTAGAYDVSFNGGVNTTYDGVIQFPDGTDIYLTSFSEDGTQLIASTFVGGSGNDGLNYSNHIASSGYLMTGNDSLYANYADGARGEVIVDDKNNIIVASTTFSTDFPTQNAFQSNNNGAQEGVVFKMTPTLTSFWWSSYIGGVKGDAVYSVDIDADDNVYIAGGTVSSDFPTTSGVYNTNFNGGTTDGFVAKLSSNGQTILHSTYYGSNVYDQAYFVRVDKQRNVYIIGQTKASGSTLIANAAYNTPNSGQFITKFNNSLSAIEYATVFGTGSGIPNISLTAFAVDVCNRIYLSGWGCNWNAFGNNVGTTGMDITSNAQQTVTDGQDFYIMVLKDDASALDYATFFGEQHTTGYSGHDHVDGGTARFDKKGNIYQSVCASCGNYENGGTSCDDFPTTTGVWSEHNGGYQATNWNCNNAVFRFSFVDDIAAADFYFPGNGCAPYDVQFVNTSMGSTYHWDFGDGATSTDVNPTHTFAEGTWDITLISNDPSTCNLSDTVKKTIIVGYVNSDTLAVTHICSGNSVQVGINENIPGVTYSWTPSSTLSNTAISNPVASPTTTTWYHMSATYSSCKEMDQLVVVHDGIVDVTAYPDTGICIGETVTLFSQATDSMASYSWYDITNPGNILSNIDSIEVTPYQTTEYIIHVVEPYCNVHAYDTVNVELIPLSLNLANDTVICLGDTFNLHVTNVYPNDTITYSWQPVSDIISGNFTNSPLVSPNQQTTYYVNAVNQRTCETTDSITVHIDYLQANIQEQEILCYGDFTGALNVSANGYSPYVYEWSSGGNDSTETNLPAGDYIVTIIDEIGCELVVNHALVQPSLLQATVTDVQNTLCGTLTEVGSIATSTLGGTPTYNYNWNNGDTTANIENLGYGDYILTVTDDNGCDTVLSAHIEDSSNLEISTIATNASCYGYCDGASIVNIETAGTPPYIYSWSTNEVTPNVNDLCTGVYSVYVYDSDTCQRFSNIYITSPDSINAQIISDGIICNNDYATAIADVVSGGTPNFSYVWSDNQVGDTATSLTEGVYSVFITDNNDCKDTVDVEFVNPPLLTKDTNAVSVTCEVACNGIGTVILDGGVTPYSYLWDNFYTDSMQTGLCPGKHYVTVSDANGCTDTLEIDIEISYDGLYVNAWADKRLIYNDETINLHTVDGENYTYNWEPSNSLNDNSLQNPIASPTEETIYRVTVTDEFGCQNIDTVIVKVKEIVCGDPFIYVPNAFTPNGDTKNDILYAYGDIIDNLYFAIYDRWGELMFETTDINKGWDGTYYGKKVDPAVFVYYIKAVCRNAETFIKRGNITLIR